MKRTWNPADGYAMTLDDLDAFVTEMKTLHNLSGDTVVRATGHLEFDMTYGPRVRQLTADPDSPSPNREQRRAAGQRGAEVMTRTDGNPRLEHDLRCPELVSPDPSRCTCRDSEGHAPRASWADGPLCAWDLETTAADPLTRKASR